MVQSCYFHFDGLQVTRNDCLLYSQSSNFEPTVTREEKSWSYPVMNQAYQWSPYLYSSTFQPQHNSLVTELEYINLHDSNRTFKVTFFIRGEYQLIKKLTILPASRGCEGSVSLFFWQKLSIDTKNVWGQINCAEINTLLGGKFISLVFN